MPKFKEEFLHFVWQHKLFKPLPLITKNGTVLEIIKTGTINTDSGADFFNAQILLNNVKLAGNVEIHINSSDWLKHKHQLDKNYDTIILHVVYTADVAIEQNTKHNVEVLEIKNLIQEGVLQNYLLLQNAKSTLPCSKLTALVPELITQSWIGRMAIERLEAKMHETQNIFEKANNDYTQTLYTLILRAFGFKVNKLPFELLALHLPYAILLKHSANLLQLEALIFGCAGMLEDSYNDKHLQAMQNEFVFLQNKYSLVCLNKGIFKNSRMRPSNFPSLRLAQFAHLMHQKPSLLSNIESIKSITDLTSAFDFKLIDYWKNHYQPDGSITNTDLNLGKNSKNSIYINAFAQFFFFYGRMLHKAFYENLAVCILEELPFEKNAKTTKYTFITGTQKNALLSQGLIHLHDNYCLPKKCLQCGIGAAVLYHPLKISYICLNGKKDNTLVRAQSLWRLRMVG